MTDDELMRFADGELEGEAAAAAARAVAADPALQAAVARQRALRVTAAAAFDDFLAEPVPDRLLALLRPAAPAAPVAMPIAAPVATPAAAPAATSATAPVADLAAARARRDSRRAESNPAPARRLPPFAARWGSLAAALVVGLIAGRALVLPLSPLSPDRALARSLDGAPAAAIAVKFSYRDQAGALCRVFRDDRAGAAGIACRDGDTWRLRVVAAAPPPSTHVYRTAAADLPPAVAATVDATIAGAPLDAAGEAAAARRGWR